MKSAIVTGIKFMLICLVGATLFVVFAVETNGDSVVIKKQIRPMVIYAVRQVETYVYRQATVHNPEGDLVPDQIDDTVKEKLKEGVKDAGL